MEAQEIKKDRNEGRKERKKEEIQGNKEGQE